MLNLTKFYHWAMIQIFFKWKTFNVILVLWQLSNDWPFTTEFEDVFLQYFTRLHLFAIHFSVAFAPWVLQEQVLQMRFWQCLVVTRGSTERRAMQMRKKLCWFHAWHVLCRPIKTLAVMCMVVVCLGEKQLSTDVWKPLNEQCSRHVNLSCIFYPPDFCYVVQKPCIALFVGIAFADRRRAWLHN